MFANESADGFIEVGVSAKLGTLNKGVFSCKERLSGKDLVVPAPRSDGSSSSSEEEAIDECFRGGWR